MPWALLTRLSMSPLGAETANSELDLALKEPVRSSGVCFKTLSPRTSLRGGMVPPDLPRTRALEIRPRRGGSRLRRRYHAQAPTGSMAVDGSSSAGPTAGQLGIQPPSQRSDVLGAGDSVPHLSSLEQDESGNSQDVESLAQVGRQVRIDSDDLQPAGELPRELLQSRLDYSAGAAPRGPEIDQNRERALLHGRVKAGAVGVHHPRERLAP